MKFLYINKKRNLTFNIISVIVLFFFSFNLNILAQTNLFNIKNNAIVSFKNNAQISINGSIIIGSSVTFQNNGNVTISGNWSNDGNQTSTAGSVTFVNSGTSTISGTTAVSTQFNSIIVNKQNSYDTVIVNTNIFSAPSDFLTLSKGIFDFRL